MLKHCNHLKVNDMLEVIHQVICGDTELRLILGEIYGLGDDKKRKVAQSMAHGCSYNLCHINSSPQIYGHFKSSE